MLGHSIICGDVITKNKKWARKCTLNPLGTTNAKYFGITMLYKPGEIVRLDTRGFEKGVMDVVVIAPDIENDMTHPKKIEEEKEEIFEKKMEEAYSNIPSLSFAMQSGLY